MCILVVAQLSAVSKNAPLPGLLAAGRHPWPPGLAARAAPVNLIQASSHPKTVFEISRQSAQGFQAWAGHGSFSARGVLRDVAS